MPRPAFNIVAAIVFGAVALAHAGRLAASLPIHVGETAIPMWVSWLGLLVSAALCLWGIRAKP